MSVIQISSFLQFYLPRLASTVEHYNDIDKATADLAAASPESLSEDFGTIDFWKIRAVYKNLIKEAVKHDTAPSINAKVREWLDAKLSQDKRERTGTQNCLHLFRCLADVSQQSRSQELGRCLVEYVQANQNRLFRRMQEVEEMAHWCFAMLNTCYEEQAGKDFVRMVATRLPDFYEQLRQRSGPKVSRVLGALQQANFAPAAPSSNPRRVQWTTTTW